MSSAVDRQIEEAKECIEKAAKLLRKLPDEWGWDSIDISYQDKYLEASIQLTKLARDL